MVRVEYRSNDAIWNSTYLPTSIQLAAGQARVASQMLKADEVRVVDSSGAQVLAQRALDVKV